MGCPLCLGEAIPSDTQLAEKQGRRVSVQGKVYKIIQPPDLQPEVAYSPYKNYATVTLYPRKGPVKYLKFRTSEGLAKWHFIQNMNFIVEGCLHYVDGKELVFDITSVILVF